MELQALSVGHALDVDSSGTGAVHSVFARALNVEIRGDLWTLLGTERTDLPYGIRVASRDLDTLGLHRGDPVHVRSGFVGIGTASTRLVVDCRSAPRWRPICDGRRAPGLSERLALIAAAARHRAWHDSSRMAHAVTAALGDPQALGTVVADVLGRGPGSTPAGDDVLVGILAVRTSPHSGPAGAAAAALLRRSMLPLLSSTSEISGHLLRQAADGLFSRAVHELISSLIGDPDPQRFRQTIQRVIETGATSGADTCVGVVASASAWLVPQHERAAA